MERLQPWELLLVLGSLTDNVLGSRLLVQDSGRLWHRDQRRPQEREQCRDPPPTGYRYCSSRLPQNTHNHSNSRRMCRKCKNMCPSAHCTCPTSSSTPGKVCCAPALSMIKHTHTATLHELPSDNLPSLRSSRTAQRSGSFCVQAF